MTQSRVLPSLSLKVKGNFCFYFACTTTATRTLHKEHPKSSSESSHQILQFFFVCYFCVLSFHLSRIIVITSGRRGNRWQTIVLNHALTLWGIPRKSRTNLLQWPCWPSFIFKYKKKKEERNNNQEHQGNVACYFYSRRTGSSSSEAGGRSFCFCGGWLKFVVVYKTQVVSARPDHLAWSRAPCWMFIALFQLIP